MENLNNRLATTAHVSTIIRNIVVMVVAVLQAWVHGLRAWFLN